MVGFLESVRKLPEKYHQQFYLAAHHYASALRWMGFDHQMVFIRLVSAVESLSSHFIETKDVLTKADKKIEQLITSSNLEDAEKEELLKIFNVRRARQKFVRFIQTYSKRFFIGKKYKGKELIRIKKNQLPMYAKRIYDARSAYLHSGEPMNISPEMVYLWDIDSSLGGIRDQREWGENQKLPRAHWFEGLVRHCLLNFLKHQTTGKF
jgi:hypothetical protein